MTTNRHRAEDVLAYTLIQYRRSRPGDVAAALADALHTNGLLTPDGLRYEYDDHDTQHHRRRLVGPWHQTNPNRKERTPTTTSRAEAILTARHHKDQIEGDGAVGCFDAAAAVAELHAAGLLAPDMAAMQAEMHEEWGVHVTGYPTNIADWAEICDGPADSTAWFADEEAAEAFATEREDDGYDTRLTRRYVTEPEVIP